MVEEGGRIELHRASTRLTVLQTASQPNWLRPPHQVPMRFEGIDNENLEAPTGFEPAWQPLQEMRLAIRATGPRVIYIVT